MKSKETFQQKLARSDPEFLEFLKGEKSDLLAFEDGDLSEASDDENAEENMETDDVCGDGSSSSRKKKQKVKCHIFRLASSEIDLTETYYNFSFNLNNLKYLLILY